MDKKDGRQRVYINGVSPELNHGRYPIKRTIGEPVSVTAEMFADGHDVIRAKLLYKHERQRNWREIDMVETTQDHFSAAFTVVKKGTYLYTVSAWIDHALSWYRDIGKKIQDGQKVAVELQMGALYCKAAGKIASGTAKQQLKVYQHLFADPDKIQEASVAAMDQALYDLLYQYPDIQQATTYPLFLRADVEFSKALFSAWYEFFPRSANNQKGKHGTFADCIALLPRISTMGFDTIYLPPIHPIGEKNRKGKNNITVAEKGDVGSPWAIGSKQGGHKAIHPKLGTMDDFHALVKAAKEYDIDIALDIAFQCAPDHPYVKTHPQWFKWRPDGTVQYAENPPKKYQDVLPINFETADWKNLWDELKSIFFFWIEQGVRIFRIDNPHTKPFTFWEWVIQEVRRKHPDTIFLAEAFTKPSVMKHLGKIGFNQSYTYFTWRPDKASLIAYMEELTRSDMRDYYRPNFWPNTPDINPWQLQVPNENHYMIRYFLAATLSSNYGMYGPAYEYMACDPVEGKEEYLFSEKYEIKDWDWSIQNRITRLITMVNAIRKENKALHTTWNIDFCENHNDQVLAYHKTDHQHTNHLLMVVNLDPDHTQEDTIRLPLHHWDAKPGDRFLMSDLLTGAQYMWEQEWNFVRLDPFHFPFHLFKVHKL